MRIEFEPSAENAKYIQDKGETPENLAHILNEYLDRIRMWHVLRSASIGVEGRIRVAQRYIRHIEYSMLKAEVTGESVPDQPQSNEWYENDLREARAKKDDIARIAADYFGKLNMQRYFSA
jgi:hypothetical protein